MGKAKRGEWGHWSSTVGTARASFRKLGFRRRLVVLLTLAGFLPCFVVFLSGRGFYLAAAGGIPQGGGLREPPAEGDPRLPQEQEPPGPVHPGLRGRAIRRRPGVGTVRFSRATSVISVIAQLVAGGRGRVSQSRVAAVSRRTYAWRRNVEYGRSQGTAGLIRCILPISRFFFISHGMRDIFGLPYLR